MSDLVCRENRKPVVQFLSFFLVFLFNLVFFTRVVPLVIYNMDDWMYLYPGSRKLPLPEWGAWNPSRILPEFLMPLTAQLSVNLIFPLTGAFIRSIELGMSLVVSAFVTLYCWMFYRMIVKKTSCKLGLLLTVLFLILHFLVFRTQAEGNDYLLAGYYDTTTFFFYLIPALWNASLVMYFISDDYFRTRKEKSLIVRALILLAVYLGIFSNLFQSVILAVYTGIELLLKSGKKRSFMNWLRQSSFHLSILLLWLVSLVFEFFGGRSQQVGAGSFGALKGQICSSGITLLDRLSDVNGVFVVLLILSVLIWLVTIFSRKTPVCEKKEHRIRGSVFLLCAVLTLVYEWILCSASFPGYIMRGDVLICCFFFLFLFMLAQIRTLTCKKAVFCRYLPLVVFLCFFCTLTPGRTWMIRTNNRLDPAVAREITEEIVSTVVEANGAGENAVDVSVPVFSGDNWPIALYGSGRISDVLYKYGQITKRMEVTFVQDPEMNRRFGLVVPE